LLAGVETRAGEGEGPPRRLARAQLCHQFAGAAIEPEPGRANGLARRVDQPGAVTLSGHGKCRDLAPRQSRAQFRQRRDRVAPASRHVLLDTTARDVFDPVGSRGARERPPRRVERHRLDHRGS
jgi:hypothetical protein